MLIDLTPAIVPDAQIGALANQLRLPAAYLDTPEGAERLRLHAEAANALIERRIGHALFERCVEYRFSSWLERKRQGLPLAPVRSVQEVGVIAPDGALTLADLDQLRVDDADGAPILETYALAGLPDIKQGHVGYVRFTVGYGSSWEAAPADLRLAASMIASALHDHGSDDPLSVSLPFGAITLLDPYRRMRL